MPNFDSFERLIRQSMTVPEGALVHVVREMSEIEDSQRPRLFKRLDYTALSEWTSRARRFLRERYGNQAVFETSADNRAGFDLRVFDTEETVELKSGGPVTDANPGVSSIAWALGGSSLELKKIMTDSMRERQQAYLNGDLVKVNRSKRQTMDQLLKYFQRHLTPGNPAPARLQHYLRCVARGINNRTTIEQLEGARSLHDNAPTILHADRSLGWRTEEHAFEDTEQIFVEVVELSRTSEGAQTPRLTVLLTGQRSGRTAKIYPHYKNSWTSPEGQRVPAEHWVMTACFHIWIGEKRTR